VPLDPEVAAALGRLAEQGITVFIPDGAEDSLTYEDGKLIITGKIIEERDVWHCIQCGGESDDPSDHFCDPAATASPN
jgi:hypothetical protein